jgi:hypothetical protein
MSSRLVTPCCRVRATGSSQPTSLTPNVSTKPSRAGHVTEAAAFPTSGNGGEARGRRSMPTRTPGGS